MAGLEKPPASSDEARRRMQANRGRDTKPERLLRSELHRMGLRYRLHRAIVPGSRRRADIVFGPARIAVFVDGCFWHGCPTHGTQAKANATYWRAKIAENQKRDRDTDERLTEVGWQVVRAWEHEDPSEVAKRIRRAVRRRTDMRSRSRS